MANEIKTQQAKVQDLHFDDLNFNKHTQFGMSLMEKSLRQHGAGRSVLVDKNNRLIAGNGIVETASQIGLEDVVIVETTGEQLVVVKRTDVDLDSKQGREMAAADNATSAADLEWNAANLAIAESEWGIHREDWGIELPESGLGGAAQKDTKDDDFDPDKAVKERVKPGEIWQLGAHRLMCGDSTKKEDIARLMAGEKADCWLTDPPYNVDYQGGTEDQMKIQNDNMSSEDFFKFLHAAFSAAVEVLKPGAAFYIWFASREHCNFEKALNAAGLVVREELIWVKNSLVLGRQDYQWKHEPCLYGWKDGAGHQWYNDRCQTTTMEFDRPTKSDLHPTMKPVPLFAYQVQNSTKEGDIVLDTFGGSGTSIMACEQSGRQCRTMELDPHYASVIVTRWEEFTGEKAIKID